MRIGIKSILGFVGVVALVSVAWLQYPWIATNANQLIGKPYTISSSMQHAKTRGVLDAIASAETFSANDGVEFVEAWVETNSTTKRKTTFLCFKLNHGALGIGIKLKRLDGSHDIVPTANRSNTVALFLAESPTSVDEILVPYFDGKFDTDNPIIFYRHANGASLDENESSIDNEILKLRISDLKPHGKNAG